MGPLGVPGERVVIRSGGLVLREWRPGDVGAMVGLFDTAEMDRWTPLASPFDRDVAEAYVARAAEGREDGGTLQLAITVDGERPLGEVILFGADEPDCVELAYAVGAHHRGQSLAARAIEAVLPVAVRAGTARGQLVIAVDNRASQAVARRAGFALTDAPPFERRPEGPSAAHADLETPPRPQMTRRWPAARPHQPSGPERVISPRVG